MIATGPGGWSGGELARALAAALAADLDRARTRRVLGLLALAAVLLLATVALAHGPAAWIQAQPAYVDREGVHCCGEHDCAPVPLAALIEADGGVSYRGQTLWRRERGVYWSAEPDPPVEQRPWVCMRAGKVRCIFLPQPGS